MVSRKITQTTWQKLSTAYWYSELIHQITNKIFKTLKNVKDTLMYNDDRISIFVFAGNVANLFSLHGTLRVMKNKKTKKDIVAVIKNRFCRNTDMRNREFHGGDKVFLYRF